MLNLSHLSKNSHLDSISYSRNAVSTFVSFSFVTVGGDMLYDLAWESCVVQQFIGISLPQWRGDSAP